MKEAPGSSETSVLTRATRHNNPEDTILHCIGLFSRVERRLVTANYKGQKSVIFHVLEYTIAEFDTLSFVV
jgi:hypothetical protein